MVLFTRVPREEMAAKHAAVRAEREPVLQPRTANMRVMLDLGDTVYVSFRGRAYGVPPVGWRIGQKIGAVRLLAMDAAGNGTLTIDSSPRYFAAIGRLADVLWAHAVPVGRWRRLAKRLGLMRNPFQAGTEAEVVALADFFLQRRTTSSVGSLAVEALPKSPTR